MTLNKCFYDYHHLSRAINTTLAHIDPKKHDLPHLDRLSSLDDDTFLALHNSQKATIRIYSLEVNSIPIQGEGEYLTIGQAKALQQEHTAKGDIAIIRTKK